MVETETDHNTGITTLLFARTVWVLLSPSVEGSRDWTYGLTSLSKMTRRSNHFQILEQRQHLLLNYFKTLSVGPAGNRTRASRTIDWHLTNYANQTAVNYFKQLPKRYNENRYLGTFIE